MTRQRRPLHRNPTRFILASCPKSEAHDFSTSGSDFGAPPVTEVALGVQFNSLARLLAPHLGIIWSEFKDQFPEIEQHPPLDPVFETFAEKGSRMPIPRLNLELLTNIPTPSFFINSANTELLQVQRDCFHHNWRKVGEGDAYPRFERMLETFEGGYRKLEAVLARENLGSIEPNQCEVTYINQIPLPAEQSPFEAFERLFGSFTQALVLDELRAPEDARFLIRYIIHGEDGTPAGRLIIYCRARVETGRNQYRPTHALGPRQATHRRSGWSKQLSPARPQTYRPRFHRVDERKNAQDLGEEAMNTAVASDLWHRPTWPQPQPALVFVDSVSEPVRVVRPAVSPPTTASPAQWLDPTLLRVRELAALGHDWDRRGSAAVRKDVLAFAYSMLSEVMAPTTAAPSIVPLGHGGVQLLWANPATEIEVEIARQNELVIYVLDRATGVENEWHATTEFTGLGDRLRSAFSQ